MFTNFFTAENPQEFLNFLDYPKMNFMYSYGNDNRFLYNKEDNSLYIAAPGFSKNDLDISFDGKILNIKSTSKNSVGNTLDISLRVSNTIDIDKKNVTYENGILKFSLLEKKSDKNKITIS